MLLEAVYHSTGSEYCHAIDESTVILRLRAKKGDIQNCTVFFGDRASPVQPLRMASLELHIVASDSLFDYFEAELSTSLTRICYYFVLYDGKTSVFYYGNQFHDHLDHDRNQYFQLPFIRKEDIADVPGWAKEAVIYQIFPDSFASARAAISGKGTELPDGDGIFCRSRLGGKLRGVMENIPYLQELGVSCIYMTPIFAAGSYHKYDTIDYYSVDPCFGDLGTLKELVSSCHEAGIRVLLDGVFNHSGRDFFAFRDVLEKGRGSPYKDWFFIREFPANPGDTPDYAYFAYDKSMPKLNTGNREVVEYFKNVGTYWIREADIDGWRLDVANEVNHDFWREFRRAVREVKPDAFLLGEIWHDAGEWLQGDQFDSVMNYRFTHACTDFFAKRTINVRQFDERINYLLMRYKKNVRYVQMNLLDSHDIPRFLTAAGGDIRKQKAAALFMMLYVGAPSVYYGDEKGFSGSTDLECRRPMLWEDTEYSADVLSYYKKLISIRREHMDILLGEYATRQADIQKNTYVFSREAKGKKLFVAINNSESPVNIEVDIGENNGGGVEELLSGDIYTPAASKVGLELEAFGGAVLKV